MTIEESGYLILGTSKNGHKFRPSDWVERLATLYAQFDAYHRLRYNPFIRPALYENQKCLFVAEQVANLDPKAFNFVMHFARDNQLSVKTVGEPDLHLPSDEVRHVA